MDPTTILTLALAVHRMAWGTADTLTESEQDSLALAFDALTSVRLGLRDRTLACPRCQGGMHPKDEFAQCTTCLGWGIVARNENQ